MRNIAPDPTTQSNEKRRTVLEPCTLGREQLLAGAEQVSLCIENFEIIGHTLTIAQARDVGDAFLCGHSAL